jgi:quercetin dioxygenase-like cupin family protein
MTADALQVSEDVKVVALRHCRSRLDEWLISPPPVEALVMDFGLGEFSRVGLIEFWIANEIKSGYCGKYLVLANGQTCPRHSHRIKHETFFVIHGKLDVTLDDTSIELGEGQTLAIEPGRVHSFTGVGDTLMLELSMPCDVHDNYFEDKRIMRWLRSALK